MTVSSIMHAKQPAAVEHYFWCILMRSILAQPQTSLCLWSHHRWKMLLPGGNVCKLASRHLATDYPPFDSSFDGFHASFRRFVGLNRHKGEFTDEGGWTHFSPDILIFVRWATFFPTSSDLFTSTSCFWGVSFKDRTMEASSSVFFFLLFSSSTCKLTDVAFKQSTCLPPCSKQSRVSGREFQASAELAALREVERGLSVKC